MKLRVACALALAVGCEPEPLPEPPPPPRWAYPPSTPSLPLGPVRGRIGRVQAPQLTGPLGITGEVQEPLRLPTPWQVPGDGPARAIVYGTVGVASAIELVDIDHGRVVWRNTKDCTGPVVGVTDKVVVCADAKGIRAVTLDGKPAWQAESVFLAMTEDRVTVLGDGVASIRDAATGDELASVKLPAGVVPTLVDASCGDAGRELFAIGGDGKLQRVAEAAGGPKLAWSVPMGAVMSIDACTGDSIIVAEPNESGTSLVAIARTTGKISGRVDAVRGFWPARDDANRIEIATSDGVASWSRDLASSRPLPLPLLGELLAKRGDLRLVRATPFAAVLLDREGVRAYVATTALGAALGDSAIVAATWAGSPGETLHRIAIPPAWHRELRDNAPHRGLALPAELRDVPASVTADEAAITRAETAKQSVAAAAIAGDQLYVVPVEREPDDTNGGGVARIDLVEHGVRWLRPDGCGPGVPAGIAISRDAVICASSVREEDRYHDDHRDTDSSSAHDAASSTHVGPATDAATATHSATPTHVGPTTGNDAATATHAAGSTHVGAATANDAATATTTDTATHVGGTIANDAATQSPRADDPGSDAPIVHPADVPRSARSARPGALVRATSRAGTPAWDWPTDHVDAVTAAGDVVLAFDADRMTALAADDGHVLGTFASDDGASMRAVPLDIDGTTWLVTYERGRIVARLPQVELVAVWSIAVDGVVSRIAASGAGVLVALDDGDAYRIDVRSAAIDAIPGVGLDWRASDELVTGAILGGPLYGPAPPTPPPKPYVPPTTPPPTFSPPPLSVPIPTPPPIGASWQLDLFEATGGFRARNDYALAAPIALARLRGAATSPLVVSFGQHEALVIDPVHGDPVRRIQLPSDDGIPFSTIVEGHPVAGIVLATPLRVVLF